MINARYQESVDEVNDETFDMHRAFTPPTEAFKDDLFTDKPLSHD